MFKKFIYFCLGVSSLALHTKINTIPKTFFPFTSDKISPDQNIDHTHIEKGLQPKLLLPYNHDDGHESFLDIKLQKLNHFIEVQEKVIGKEIVMKISGFLPNFDTIGHKILHANNEFVSKILLETDYPDIVKKDLILFSIKMAQHGDDFGSFLLQMYYDIVNNSL
tara:strand:+ start:135 stop:629 length:495 start_codon:yes stop_codon:yes gene_type:complete